MTEPTSMDDRLAQYTEDLLAERRPDLAALLAGPTFDRASANALIQSKVSAVQIKSPAVVTAFADFVRPCRRRKL